MGTMGKFTFSRASPQIPQSKSNGEAHPIHDETGNSHLVSKQSISALENDPNL